MPVQDPEAMLPYDAVPVPDDSSESDRDDRGPASLMALYERSRSFTGETPYHAQMDEGTREALLARPLVGKIASLSFRRLVST